MTERDTSTVGEVILIGAGPGHWELLTEEAHMAMMRADVILYDRLAAWALQLVRGVVHTDEERLIDVGKQPGGGGWSQEAINSLLVEKACEGKRVARLKSAGVHDRAEAETPWLKTRWSLAPSSPTR